MKLPGGDRAIVDIAKLRDYCLNEFHPRGRHKARVFAFALGLTVLDAESLRRQLLNAALKGEVQEGELDDYGQRYVLDLDVTGPAGRARVRSTWIILRAEDFPQMTSCYVL